jgi:hypothetical protein
LVSPSPERAIDQRQRNRRFEAAQDHSRNKQPAQRRFKDGVAITSTFRKIN